MYREINPIAQISMKQTVTLQERAHTIGNIIGINAYRINQPALHQGLMAQGYDLHETPHFLIARRGIIHYALSPDTLEYRTLIAHWFAPSSIDANLGHYVMSEIKPFGLLSDPERFGNVFGAIVMSLAPRDPERAWRLYGRNTLTRYHALMDNPPMTPHTDFPIEVFATLYKRVCELLVGSSLLDAGCSFGSLPLVVAERIPTLKRVVGVDIETGPFVTVQALAHERKLTNVQFLQADLLTDKVEQHGQFDTITILHVLEHFTEKEMFEVISHLLPIVTQRLIIAVPYEEGEPEEAYGHKQLFTPEKLGKLGQWCIERLGRGTFAVEECVGGLLVLYL